MPKNNAKKWTIISLIVTVLSIAMVVVGFVGDELYWMIMVGLMLGITFFICIFVFLSQARRLDRMFNREELLVHWAFDPSEHLKKAAEEYREKKQANRVLLIIMTCFFVLISAGFALFGFDDLEEAAPFLLVMLSVLVLIYLVALSAPRASYRRMIKSPAEVYVGPYGAWVMGEYVQWRAPMTRLEGVTFEQNQSRAIIAIHYAIRQRYGFQHNTSRIPVPAGKEQEAHAVAMKIAMNSNVPFDAGNLNDEVESDIV